MVKDPEVPFVRDRQTGVRLCQHTGCLQKQPFGDLLRQEGQVCSMHR